MLFRQTHRAFREVFGSACGEAFLAFFRDRESFLDDLCLISVNDMDEDARDEERLAGVHLLSTRIAAARPDTVLVVMKAIVPCVRQACALAGSQPVFGELPFPGRPAHRSQFLDG